MSLGSTVPQFYYLQVEKCTWLFLSHRSVVEINEYGFFQALESFQGSHILCKIAFTLLIVCLRLSLNLIHIFLYS